MDDAGRLPPGPRLPRAVQSVGMMRLRHRWVPRLHRRYGDAFTVRLLPAGRDIVLFSDPAAVREIFAGDPAVFHAGEANSLLGPVMGQHSVLLLDGAGHRRARALLTPAFSGRALRGYADLVTGLAKTEVGSWTPGVPFPVLDRMNALTLEVILRVVFGVSDEARLERLRPLVRDLVDVSPLVFLGYAVPRLRSVGMWRRAAERTAALDVLVRDEIRERRASPDLEQRADVLSRLIRVDDGGDRLTDDELRDQLVTLLLAGHETTATALAWTLHEIGLDPALGARAARPPAAATTTCSRPSSRRRCACTPSSRWSCGCCGRRPPSAASTCRPAPRSRPRSCSPTRGPRATRTPAPSGPSDSSAASPPRTPGSPSAAGYGAASVPGSR